MMMNHSKTNTWKPSGRKVLLQALMACTVLAAPIAFGPRASAQAGSEQPAALTESGVVTGATVGGIDEYLGIPYAAPPVGELRWRPPQPYGHFPGFKYAATQFGNECTQPTGYGAPAGGSEDCLFLNVYVPQHKPGNGLQRPLPVMVYIHGGALIDGDSSWFDPTPLVQRDVIVVTINYRLGYLGFFAQKAIDAEGHLNGNYGLMDQQFALKWVQRNIAGFGGDPGQVTLFGQSAGAQSVYSQLASPLAAGLFKGAISESGAYVNFESYYNSVIPLTQGETTGTAGLVGVPSGEAIANAVGCTDQTADCLRAVPAADFMPLEPGLAIFPFVDGKVLPQTIAQAIESGHFNHVPVISGGNHDEARFYVALLFDFSGEPVQSPAVYDAGVETFFGPQSNPSANLNPNLATIVEGLYPYGDYAYGGEALGASTTDGYFNCPEYNAVNALSKYVPTHAYEFNDENAPPSQSEVNAVYPYPILTFPLGAYHGAEIQYFFHETFPPTFFLPPGPLSPEQQQLSDSMIGYWTQFAKTGDPNSAGLPYWPRYSAANNSFESLAPPTPQVETDFDSEHLCSAFWNTL